MSLDRRSLIAKAKNETHYVVYLEWPDGPGGGIRYDNRDEAVQAAIALAKEWSHHQCEARCLKRTRTFIDFKKDEPCKATDQSPTKPTVPTPEASRS